MAAAPRRFLFSGAIVRWPKTNKDRDSLCLETRGLLEDRFQLSIHEEKRKLPAYVLSVSPKGSKLKLAKPGGKFPDGTDGAIDMNVGEIRGESISMDFLAQAITQEVGRIVINQTNLKGLFDFDVKFTLDSPPSVLMFNGGPDNPSPQSPDRKPQSPFGTPAIDSQPLLATALEEQLGLSLRYGREPLDAVVIDHVEDASAN